MNYSSIATDRKVVDGIKMKLFGATTITRKIILEGGHVIIDDGSGSGSSSGSGSGAAVEANDAPLTILKQQGIMIMIILVIHIFLQILPHLANVDVTAEATAEEHNITVDNLSTVSQEEEKVEPVSSGERNNYPFEGFNISDKAPKKLTKLINDYSEWIVDGLLKHHTGRYCQQQPKVFRNKECLINIIKGFNIPAGLSWHLVDKVYIPINCGDEFHWILVVVILKKRRIRVHDSMSRRRHSSDLSTIEAYQDKIDNPFDVQYVEGIAQQTIGSLDCDLFVVAYTEYLSDGLHVPNDGLNVGLLRKRYASLLWKYGEAKAQKPYT
ncbi:hypothetical protein BC332_18165 [Capsicum chinense]|nr:hypothetical protein BC332_18165 [Capsicum chinense]